MLVAVVAVRNLLEIQAAAMAVVVLVVAQT